MTTSDLCWTPATELVALIRKKALSPVELMRATLERIERLNPTLNAFCTLVPEAALEEARRAEQAVARGERLGALHGIPVSIKDLALAAGMRFMSGSFIFEGRVPDQDAPFVRRLRAAGAIVVGKTTTPEFGWKALGDSPLTGITRNPWNTGMTTGGSSAGAAAAAAAGLGPLHHGSDGAGSIRIPSAFCGIFGFKPSYGRVPQWPVSNNDYSTHHGPMTRTVADAALMLSVMAGPDEWDRTSLEGTPADYVGRLGEPIRGLRVAWSPTLGGLRVDPDVAAIVEGAVRAFEELGCAVETVDSVFPESGPLIRGTWAAHEAGNYGPYIAEWGGRMDPGLLACIEAGLRLGLVDYIRLRGEKMAYWDAIRTLFERFDLLLTPSVSVPAFEVMRLNPEGWPQHEWDWFPWASFSYPFNFTGQPAATLPCGFTASGMPLGLQVVGRRFADLTVLQAAAAFEAAHPWAQRRPPVEAPPAG
ncbi:MAG: amidase [Candidatus Rokubacteria bacterium GWC2_70_16]|nr:MAG: amidase [Candidatus Rokubacteria bacterium GWC2_70_16]OGL15083.1 MAG: amidase [Candidatus Rokubacteria bacterium RIFCSPLOWO2_12_FULL_71_19]